MTRKPSGQPYLALVDDDSHSARMLTRTLLAQGAPSVEWIGDADEAARELASASAHDPAELPGMVIVDLKTSSSATADFIRRLQQLERLRGVPVVAITPTLDTALRESLLCAGAAAVFARHGDIASYREEAASMVRFWTKRRSAPLN